MKRKGGLYSEICSTENLILADKRAQKGKRKQYGVKQFNKNKPANILALQQMLLTKTYRTSEYKKFR